MIKVDLPTPSDRKQQEEVLKAEVSSVWLPFDALEAAKDAPSPTRRTLTSLRMI